MASDNTKKMDQLRELSLFESIPSEILEPLLGHFVSRKFQRGDTIWRQGSPANQFTFIVQGKVKVLKYQNDGKEIILGIFGEGEPVGEIAVYQRIEFPASAVALEETEVLQIHRDHFYGTIKSNTQLLEATINSMMRRNQHLVGRIDELATDGAEQRLAMLFCKFSEKMGRRTHLVDGTMGVHIDLDLTRRDIADLINTRVETAIRIMSRWNKEGPVTTEKDGFLVIDIQKLDQLARAI
ncbi:Crp/Fnr family transcriptional regulator [Bradymonas sediminis]|uniref:Uncharacterized protein n=1 Tax=Bradymonas sediminis TaxID=1548548 RepID=A0A2Z4FIK2_9DELT|nr:Crp/Fnr family transcriptional regulator [Bradymonas sediminis]AWV88857.1 hypothetical protein DN745_05690 [Bradymonas sediminis]TDP71859.1 CRP/FNR family transcriptional regulator [Bradymonas sediminis]